MHGGGNPFAKATNKTNTAPLHSTVQECDATNDEIYSLAGNIITPLTIMIVL